MFNKNLKKKVAVLLTGIMVLGMTVSAGAAVTGTEVSSDGTGNFEGHVNRKVVDVTLPTVSANTYPFSFIYDAEGLIDETNAAAYGDDYNFENGTLVYFKTADKTFGKDSTKFTVSNNSSVSVNVTLKIDVKAGAKDPKLVGAPEELPDNYDSTHASGDASLFLGLKVTGDSTGATIDGKETAGNDTYSISGNGISKVFNLEGTPANYSVSINKVGEADYPHDYKFKKKALADQVAWQKMEFQLTGKANKVENGKNLTAPDLTVTWNFAALDDEAEKADDESGSGSGSGGTTPSVTDITGAYVSGADYWYYELSLPTGTVLSDISDVSNLKVNGNAVASGAYLNSAKTKVRVPRADVKTALGDAWGTTDEFTFTFTANDVNYSAANVSKN
jgi:hypothetical protein